MRKPRDFESELKVLADKARHLKERRVQQLGELVIATGASDTIDPETLAGALLVIAETNDPARKESWRKRGAAFFQGKARGRTAGTAHDKGGAASNDSGAASA